MGQEIVALATASLESFRVWRRQHQYLSGLERPKIAEGKLDALERTSSSWQERQSSKGAKGMPMLLFWCSPSILYANMVLEALQNN